MTDTPAIAMMRQINTLTAAIDTIRNAVDDVTGLVNPDDATWADVARLAAIVDAVRRSGLVSDD